MATSLPLRDLLPRFRQARVAVVGDMILDRYIFGKVTRISPEAPVPVVHVEREEETPGGAANVARNISGLGGQVVVCGVIGRDAHGETLRRLLVESGAACDGGLVVVGDRPTTVKTRVIARTNNQQQVVRIDHEETRPIPEAARVQIEECVTGLIARGEIQAVVFEDYAKGVLAKEMMQRLTDRAAARGVVTVLDPNPAHKFDIRGLDVMKPNRAEAFGLAGMPADTAPVYPIEDDANLREACHRLRAHWAVKHLLITLGRHGMALFSGSDIPLHLPTCAREVFDVSGAGDCVTATYTLALLAGASPADAARLANYAAGIVVAKIGTCPVTAAELAAALGEE
ncbi:MAG: PfkB family carbohydrate kinase [Lentisphaeria bacterium]